MPFMTQNISDRVKSFLDNDFIIRKCLMRNILSLRALARHIIKELELKENDKELAKLNLEEKKEF